MMMDVILNKKESIERCVRQIRLYYAMPSKLPFEKDHLKQDAIAANLQRAAEQAIDLTNHVIRKGKLGLPKESRESFEILAKTGVKNPETIQNTASEAKLNWLEEANRFVNEFVPTQKQVRWKKIVVRWLNYPKKNGDFLLSLIVISNISLIVIFIIYP